jgi:hypothetical protein
MGIAPPSSCARASCTTEPAKVEEERQGEDGHEHVEGERTPGDTATKSAVQALVAPAQVPHEAPATGRAPAAHARGPSVDGDKVGRPASRTRLSGIQGDPSAAAPARSAPASTISPTADAPGPPCRDSRAARERRASATRAAALRNHAPHGRAQAALASACAASGHAGIGRFPGRCAVVGPPPATEGHTPDCEGEEQEESGKGTQRNGSTRAAPPRYHVLDVLGGGRSGGSSTCRHQRRPPTTRHSSSGPHRRERGLRGITLSPHC